MQDHQKEGERGHQEKQRRSPEKRYDSEQGTMIHINPKEVIKITWEVEAAL